MVFSGPYCSASSVQHFINGLDAGVECILGKFADVLSWEVWLTLWRDERRCRGIQVDWCIGQSTSPAIFSVDAASSWTLCASIHSVHEVFGQCPQYHALAFG